MSRVQYLESVPREPSIEILELSESIIKFQLSNTDLSMANSLRRVMLSEIPTMAMHMVDVRSNTSPLDDQYIAHRLGLIPLVSYSVESYNYQRDCTCEDGCTDCCVKFDLKVSNSDPDNHKDVTSGHLVLQDSQGRDYDNRTAVRPVHAFQEDKEDDKHAEGSNIVIVKLGANQDIDFTATAVKGIGKEHAKWVPGIVAMQQIAIINLNRDIMDRMEDKEKKAFVKSCPTRVFRLEDDVEVVVDNPLACMFCEECSKWAEEAKKPDLVAVDINEREFIFTVESFGPHKPEDIVRMGMQILKKKLILMEEESSKINGISGVSDQYA